MERFKDLGITPPSTEEVFKRIENNPALKPQLDLLRESLSKFEGQFNSTILRESIVKHLSALAQRGIIDSPKVDSVSVEGNTLIVNMSIPSHLIPDGFVPTPEEKK